MKPELLLSVLIPIYGVEKYIGRCAESLFSQTLKEGIEYIFVNDVTRDGSMKVLESIIEKYPERKDQVKIINHEENQGLAGARFTGLKHAEGRYVAVCDSDDRVEPDMYESMLRAAEQCDADMVLCQYYIDYPDRMTSSSQRFTTDKEELLRRVIAGEVHCGLWNKMAKRELFEKLSPSFIPGVNMWEDVSVLPRLVHLSQRIAIVDRPLYHYAQINPEAYTQKWNAKYSEQICKAVDVNLDYFSSHGVDATMLAQRGLLSILTHETNDRRKYYFELFKKRGLLDEIKYTGSSAYGKILGKLLLKQRYALADMVIGFKTALRKMKIC